MTWPFPNAAIFGCQKEYAKVDIGVAKQIGERRDGAVLRIIAGGIEMEQA